MKYTTILVLGFLLLAASAAAQEFRGVSLEMTVSNSQGREQVVVLGSREGATTGLDPSLEESELPPLPPNEIFDARCISTPGKSQLGLGSLADYRPWPSAPMTETYTIGYQAGIDASGVILSWSENLPGRITKLMVDGEDVMGQTSVETQFATGQIIVEVGFDPAPLSFMATPNPMSFMVNNKDPLPSKMLTISPQGDATASWVLSTNVDWLSFVPAAGEGEQEVEVSVNTQVLEPGEYSGMIYVRSPVYNAEADVEVNMEMVLGAEAVHRPGTLMLSQNYPNPFNPSTVIDLDLGTILSKERPSLRIFDLLGREVVDLSSELLIRSGVQSVHFDAAALAAGSYRYVLRYGERLESRTMTLVK
ncbi:hypothetical protein KQI65_16410 [bacterium]|nr:hypothetical protein [bacterium]